MIKANKFWKFAKEISELVDTWPNYKKESNVFPCRSIKDPEFHKAIINSGITVKEICNELTVPRPIAEKWFTGESAPHPEMQGIVLDWLKKVK